MTTIARFDNHKRVSFVTRLSIAHSEMILAASLGPWHKIQSIHVPCDQPLCSDCRVLLPHVSSCSTPELFSRCVPSQQVALSRPSSRRIILEARRLAQLKSTKKLVHTQLGLRQQVLQCHQAIRCRLALELYSDDVVLSSRDFVLNDDHGAELSSVTHLGGDDFGHDSQIGGSSSIDSFGVVCEE